MKTKPKARQPILYVCRYSRYFGGFISHLFCDGTVHVFEDLLAGDEGMLWYNIPEEANSYLQQKSRFHHVDGVQSVYYVPIFQAFHVHD